MNKLNNTILGAVIFLVLLMGVINASMGYELVTELKVNQKYPECSKLIDTITGNLTLQIGVCGGLLTAYILYFVLKLFDIISFDIFEHINILTFVTFSIVSTNLFCSIINTTQSEPINICYQTDKLTKLSPFMWVSYINMGISLLLFVYYMRYYYGEITQKFGKKGDTSSIDNELKELRQKLASKESETTANKLALTLSDEVQRAILNASKLEAKKQGDDCIIDRDTLTILTTNLKDMKDYLKSYKK
jgi:hypothetical protein